MLISCVMPMRNCGPFVAKAVRSVLRQRVKALQLIVVDDGSTDDGPAQVRQIATEDGRVTMVPGPRQGIAPALNEGLKHATGRFFCRCDADDAYAPPDRLTWQADYLEGHAAFDAVCGTHTITDAHDTTLAEWPLRPGPACEISDELRRGHGRTHFCTFLVRTDIVRRLGGFRSFFSGVEDADFQLRLGEHGRVWFEPRPCYRYRLHRGGITQMQQTAKRAWLEGLVHDFQRERQETGSDPLLRGEVPAMPTTFPDARPSDTPKHAANRVQSILVQKAMDHHRHGERAAAVAAAWRAAWAAPRHGLGWRLVASLAVRRPGAAPREELSGWQSRGGGMPK